MSGVEEHQETQGAASLVSSGCAADRLTAEAQHAGVPWTDHNLWLGVLTG